MAQTFNGKIWNLMKNFNLVHLSRNLKLIWWISLSLNLQRNWWKNYFFWAVSYFSMKSVWTINKLCTTFQIPNMKTPELEGSTKYPPPNIPNSKLQSHQNVETKTIHPQSPGTRQPNAIDPATLCHPKALVRRPAARDTRQKTTSPPTEHPAVWPKLCKSDNF